MNKAAVIDLGSNSVRMGIFELEGKEIVQTERFRYQVRIAEGLAVDNLLKDEPVKRTFEATKKLKEIADQKDIKRIKMVATEALRRAQNSEVFTSKVKKELGIDVEIIDGLKEAELDVMAAKMSVDYNDFYMLDTGGGSLELALVMNKTVKKACCLPLGSVVMTEKFLPNGKGFTELESFIKNELLNSGVLEMKNLPIVALGGSNKELAKIYIKTEENVDGYSMNVNDAFEIYESLKNMTIEERKTVKGLDEKRADTVVTGLCPLIVLCRILNAKKISFCTGSVREGVAAELLL